MLGFRFITAQLIDISNFMKNDVVKLRCGVNCKREEGESQYFMRLDRMVADG